MLLTLAVAALLAQIPEAPGAVVDGPALRWVEVLEGTGPTASPAQKYTVHYTGWLKDGKKFDSSRDRNEPFQFVQGRRQVIAGWDMGFEGMKVGGKRRLFIPYQMAYGEKGKGPIPPRAELIFDIELLAVDEPPQSVPTTASQGANKMYGLIGKMIATADRRDELVAILLESIRDMPGCLSYVVAKDPADENAIWITEVWDSKASHDASLSLPAVKSAIARAKPVIASFSNSTVTAPVGGHGLAGVKAP